MREAKKLPVVPREKALQIAKIAMLNDTALLIDILRTIKGNGKWQEYAEKMIAWLENPTDQTPVVIFRKGNSKLPWFTFNALPIVTCTGSGDCARVCYSLKSMRYPEAFFRMLQNTVLVLRHKDILTRAFAALPSNIELRLYVDGDIESLDTLKYWMSTINTRPDVHVYGYSKSFKLFLDYASTGGQFPDNYTLNLSKGSRYDAITLLLMRALPCVRGGFHYFDCAKSELVKTALAAGLDNIFVCPGACGTCHKSGHACGNKAEFSGVEIVIATH